MTIPAPPQGLLSHLNRADGSATYSYNGYEVIGAVNGPLEVMRRDEIPDEAAIDVVVRPNAGVGGLFPLVAWLPFNNTSSKESRSDILSQSSSLRCGISSLSISIQGH
jgi:hypothetical protein